MCIHMYIQIAVININDSLHVYIFSKLQKFNAIQYLDKTILSVYMNA